MGTLANLAIPENAVDDGDRLGGYSPLDSDVYLMNIDLAYLDKSAGGALSLNFHFKNAAGQTLRQTLWLTGGDKKGNKNYYERNGKQYPLPGMILADHVSLLACSKTFNKLEDPVKGTINLYNSTAGAEVPTEVEVVKELMGQQVKLGVVRQVVDKNVKNDAGVYVPSGETREENEVDKIFSAADDRTVTEIRAKASEAVFMHKWLEKMKGQVLQKAKGKSADSPASGGTQTAAAAVDTIF